MINRPWRIGISGSSGLIGSELTRVLSVGGHIPIPLVRRASMHPEAIDPWHDEKADAKLERLDAVVHLAGRSIMPPWTERARKEIRSSRVDLTRQLCERLSRLREGPRVLLSGSAMGIYGDRSDEILTERSSTASEGFLPLVAREWEAATAPEIGNGKRVVQLRTGIVLDRHGGALKKMLLPFRLGLGGPLGTGQQWFSWITLRDMVGAMLQLLFHSDIHGPVNLVAPHPVTNEEFTAALARAIHRPAFLRVPVPVLRWVLGDAADELFLLSQRGAPEVLGQIGYPFQDPGIDQALQQVLG